MPFAETVRARGFRRWYERQLYESHAYLITGLLSLVMVAIVLEESSFRESAGGFLLSFAIATAGGWLGIYAWRKFSQLLFRAELIASQASCPRCSAYGRFAVVRLRDSEESLVGCPLSVRCRLCAEEWTIA